MSKFKIKIACLIFLPVYFLSSTVLPVFAAINYSYDANGNMNSDGTNCYTYNDANQLTKVTNCNTGQTIAQYVYDYQGNRIEKKVYNGGNLQKTVYSPNDGYETVKLASNGATQNTSYYFANDQLLAKKNPDGSKNYFLNDNLNSTNVIANQSGSVVEKTTYYPYGQIRSGGTQSKYLYTGQEKDSETGLDYYNSRYYSSQLQRFIQPDTVLPNPYDPQSLNRYSYVENNPLTYIDPTGHDAVIDLGLSISAALIATYFLYQPVVNVIHSLAALITSYHTTLPAPLTTATLQASKPVVPPTNKTNTGKTSGSGSSGGSTSGGSSQKPPIGDDLKNAAIKAGTAATLWPTSANGRQVINGILYTAHALARMGPVGTLFEESPLGTTVSYSRGIPPSIVQNAIDVGQKIMQSDGTVLNIYENLTVVTNQALNKVITVWKND